MSISSRRLRDETDRSGGAGRAVDGRVDTPSPGHGDAPHPKCKKGYALDAEHKCIKAAKK
jgi:hypothetical protein